MGTPVDREGLAGFLVAAETAVVNAERDLRDQLRYTAAAADRVASAREDLQRYRRLLDEYDETGTAIAEGKE